MSRNVIDGRQNAGQI